MNPRTFQTIRRPEIFIGRQTLLDKIKSALGQAVSQHDRAVVIAIRAPGGLGKTRLLEEVLMRLGHQDIPWRLGLSEYQGETWEFSNTQYVPSDILEFALPELSVQPTLLQALHGSLAHEPAMSFETFDYLQIQMRRSLQEQRGFQAFREAQKKAEAAFFQDLQQNVLSRRRPLWAWDTIERLALPLQSALWHDLAEVLDEPLLSWEEADLVAGPWFLDRLQKGSFKGAVFLLAGREEEGAAFWEALEKAHEKAHEKDKAFDLIWIEPEPFATEEVRVFLQHVADNIRQQPRWAKRVGTLEYLLQNEEYLGAFAQLTEGKPISLSIFADVLVTAEELPIPFLDLVQQLRRSDTKPDWEANRQRLIQEFMEALLREGLKGSLESRMLLALARSPRGLDAKQMTKLLSIEEQGIEAERICKGMEELRRLSIVKVRPCPPGMLSEEAGMALPGDDADFGGRRLMLQDEIYPMFARYILGIAPEDVRKEEESARRGQYERLRDYAEKRRRNLKERRTELFRRYVRALEIETPRQALHPRWELPSAIAEQWSWLEYRLRFWELEHLHYRMLLEPLNAWNAEYLDLAETRWYSGSLEGDIVLQSEILVLTLQYPLLLRFSGLLEADKQHPRDLRRLGYAIRTEEVTRWVKRLILAQRFHQAIVLSERIEEAIRQLPSKRQDKEGWMHPLSWGERRVWHTYARILAGEAPPLQDLEYILGFLERLISEEWQAEPFIPVPEDLQKMRPNGDILVKRVAGLQGHPAKERAHRVMAAGYNFLGYGYAAQGKFEKGREFYRRSLHHMRYIRFPAQEAATRNNMGRALASIGEEDAGLQLVYQALRLRESMAGLIPYAYSLNTAALLNNSAGRPLRSLGQAARAAAIFHQVSDYRGRGLALLELATALRRLAKTSDPGLMRTVVEEPQALLDLADQAVDEALEIFAAVHCHSGRDPTTFGFSPHGVCEPVRLVEAQLVKNEILQDKMRFARTFEGLRRLYRESEGMLRRALERCKEEDWALLTAETLVDQMETQYWYAYYLRRLPPGAEVSDARQEALARGKHILEETKKKTKKKTLIPTEAVIQEIKGEDERRPPAYKPEHAPYWQLLSKRHRFEAGILLEQFWDKSLEKNKINGHYRYKLRKDWDKNNAALANIARNFVKAVLYGRLFAARTRVIRMVYRFIGRYMDELEDLEFAWRQGPQDDTDAAKAIRTLMDTLYKNIKKTWEDYHRDDPLGRVGLENEGALARSIVPLPHELASLPRWLEEVYLLPMEPNGRSSGGSTS